MLSEASARQEKDLSTLSRRGVASLPSPPLTGTSPHRFQQFFCWKLWQLSQRAAASNSCKNTAPHKRPVRAPAYMQALAFLSKSANWHQLLSKARICNTPGPCGPHLYAEPVARPVHLARAVDDGLAHRPLVEHRQLYRDLQSSACLSGPLLLPLTCMHDVEQATKGQDSQARRHEAFGSHLGIDHAVCSWVRQRTCRELMFGLPARQLSPGVHFEIYEDLHRQT